MQSRNSNPRSRFLSEPSDLDGQLADMGRRTRETPRSHPGPQSEEERKAGGHARAPPRPAGSSTFQTSPRSFTTWPAFSPC